MNTKIEKWKKPPKEVRKPDTLRTFIEAIEGKGHYALRPGDSALKMLKRSR